MRELELKLAAPGSFVMPPLFNDQIGVTAVNELSQLDMKTIYYDTADLRLARNGVTLRYRRGEDGGPRWTLKLPVSGADATMREEQHFPGKSGQVPKQAKDLVTAYTRSSPLIAVSAISTRRYRWVLKGADDSELAEVVDDDVSVLDDGQIVGRFRELEVEGRALDHQGLERVAVLLREAGATATEPIPKSVRALGVRATGPADVPNELRVAPSDPAGRAVQAALVAGLRRLIAHDAGVRLGLDIEAVHQMRVATRRLRSDLRTFSPLIEASWAEPIRGDLKWLGGALGDVRDVDVLSEDLHSRAEDLQDELAPLFEHLAAEHSAARGKLLKALRSARYKSVLDRLVDAVTTPAFTPRSQRPCSEELPALVETTWRKLAEAGRAVGIDDSDEVYHSVRILAKRARYAAEAVAPALGVDSAKDAKRFASAAAGVQEVLGEVQDAVVALELIETIASEHSRSGRINMALGRLAEREAIRRNGGRSAFNTKWKNLDRKKNLRWLHHE